MSDLLPGHAYVDHDKKRVWVADSQGRPIFLWSLSSAYHNRDTPYICAERHSINNSTVNDIGDVSEIFKQLGILLLEVAKDV